MAVNYHRPINSSPGSVATKMRALLAALFFLHAIPLVLAQQSTARTPSSEDNPYNTSVSPALAILVVAIVSAFFLLGFFSVYLRRCTGDNSAVAPALAGIVGIGGGRSRRGTQRGLDSSVLQKFPTMVYSAVKAQKLGKESLECAVCLCEFEDDDILRLLPRCNHVFHRDCIDIWLASHVTCPVCRCNLSADEEESLPKTDHVAIGIDGDGAEAVNDEDRQAELADLVRIGSQRREAAVRSRAGSVRRVQISSRTTVDWAAMVTAESGRGGDRFMLRLPEDLRLEILAAGQLRRSSSLAAFSARGEGSSRRGYREAVGRGWRSLRIGRSGRWPFLGRSLSLSGRGESVLTAEASASGSWKGVRVTPVPMGSVSGGEGNPGDAGTSNTATQKSISKCAV